LAGRKLAEKEDAILRLRRPERKRRREEKNVQGGRRKKKEESLNLSIRQWKSLANESYSKRDEKSRQMQLNVRQRRENILKLIEKKMK